MSYFITFPPRSNRASWTFSGLLTDYDDNPLDLTGFSMVFRIGDEYSEWPTLTASTEIGNLTFPDTGVFRWSFTRDQMQSLNTGQHNTGLTLTNSDDTDTAQVSTGPLNIYDGVVPRP